MRCAALLLLASCAVALDVPPPLDPEGLGERLAMLEYLRQRGVKARAGLSDQQVAEAYAQAWQEDPANGPRLAELLRREDETRRRDALRAEIIRRFAVEPAADLDADALKALLVRLDGEQRERQADEARELAVRGEMRLQQVRFTDGGMMLGLYDPRTHRIEVHEEASGKRVGEVQLVPAKIASVVDVVIRVRPPPAAAVNGGTPGCAGEWITDPEQAARSAAAEQRPQLILFTGSDWCGWCIKLEQEVFSTPAFRAWAAQRVVLLKLDFPRKRQLPPAELQANRAVAARYGVKGYPTVVFAAADGRVLGESGYEPGGPAAWTAAADRILPAPRLRQ